MKTLIGAVLLLLMAVPVRATDYYVDASWTGTQSGTAAAPWRLRSAINWTTVATALTTDNVTIYFSSRDRWDDAGTLTIAATGSVSFALLLDGHSKYNLVDSGTTSWLAETIPIGTKDDPCTTGRATFGSSTNHSGGIYIGHNTRAYLTLYGFCMDQPVYGISIGPGTGHGAHDVHHVTVDSNYVNAPTNAEGQGIYGGDLTYNVHDLIVSRNIIANNHKECIYIGQYNFFAGGADKVAPPSADAQCTNAPSGCQDSLTGNVIEYNVCLNAGGGQEGDIDIKPGNYGAIVRYNESYSTGTGTSLACIIASASAMQIYGNYCHGQIAADPGDGGSGIQINADGDGETNEHATVGGSIYNNVFAANAQKGIFIVANLANVSLDLIANNTFVSNGQAGITANVTAGRAVTITSLTNNLFATNSAVSGTTELNLASGTTVTSADHNLFYHPAGATFINYGGSSRTWTQWQQTLGFDGNGVNADPQLNAAYRLQGGSPAIGAGQDLSATFTVDIRQVLRSVPWDIGADEYAAGGGFRELRRGIPLPGDQ